MNANQELTAPFELDSPLTDELWILCAYPAMKKGICTVLGLEHRFVVCFKTEDVAVHVERDIADENHERTPVRSTFEELHTIAVDEASDVAGIAVFGEDLNEISRRYWA